MFFWPIQNPKWFSNHQKFNESISSQVKWSTTFLVPLLHTNRVPLGISTKNAPSAQAGMSSSKLQAEGSRTSLLTNRQPRVLFHITLSGFWTFSAFSHPWNGQLLGKTIGCIHGSSHGIAKPATVTYNLCMYRSRWISGGEVLVLTVLDKHPKAGLVFPDNERMTMENQLLEDVPSIKHDEFPLSW